MVWRYEEFGSSVFLSWGVHLSMNGDGLLDDGYIYLAWCYMLPAFAYTKIVSLCCLVGYSMCLTKRKAL